MSRLRARSASSSARCSARACSRRATLCVGVSARQRWSLASSRWPLVDDDRYEACDIWRSHLVSSPMLQLLRLIALIALILALAPAPAAAADICSGQDITIAATDTIDYYRHMTRTHNQHN